MENPIEPVSLVLDIRYESGATLSHRAALPLLIGRSPECGLQLASWRVAKRHASIVEGEQGLYIDDHGSLSGTLVNGKRVSHYGPLQTQDEIVIGPCLVTLGVLKTHAAQTKVPDPGVVSASTDIAERRDDAGNAGHADTAALEDTSADQTGNVAQNASDDVYHRRRLHRALLDALDLRRRDIGSLSDAALRAHATTVLADILLKDAELPATADRQSLLQAVVNEAVGLGPLEPLLADPAISEIMVNRHDEIFVETAGVLKRHSAGFSSEQAVLGAIERIVSPLGRRIDESSPMVDGRLKDGSRINAVIPPVALRGASITIRKFPSTRPDRQDLLRVGALDTHMWAFLEACVRGRKNIIVSGGTGSGKTTLLNVLSNCIPDSERVVTIEDAAELQLDHGNLVTLEARPPNLEGRGQILIRDLVRNALRMRPDRIVVGECRGAEAFDMLAAMNTGHEGSLTTLHANSPRDALGRLETMILMAGMDLPLVAVREHIASSIDLLVQQVRLGNGRRLISAIVEVSGIESGRIQVQPLFTYRHRPSPTFEGCGVLPDFLGKDDGNAFAGINVDLFSHSTAVQDGGASFGDTERNKP